MNQRLKLPLRYRIAVGSESHSVDKKRSFIAADDADELSLKKLCRLHTLKSYEDVLKMMRTKKTKLILYLSGVFVVAQVAANISEGPHVKEANVSSPVANDPELDRKIRAFKKGGVEKKINTDDYDVDEVIEYAESLIGTPHVMGGYSTTGLDCSGLVKLAHAQVGVELPRSSHDQGRYGTIISEGEELRRGDLVFFHSTYKKSELITHSGIYLGDNKFIHTSTRRGVTISTLFDSGYYQEHFLFATRLED